eukprot:TRINITY_DN11129_c0_g1_i1.p1 TRINITY_DN11129_c0_g1~~TRINITY_DN11129_c0_g1_i1.p1  ORF type:complete len:305 (+),score=49.11 TRINITY_DN11129_c0_g1_i1:86-916(+)
MRAAYDKLPEYSQPPSEEEGQDFGSSASAAAAGLSHVNPIPMAHHPSPPPLPTATPPQSPGMMPVAQQLPSAPTHLPLPLQQLYHQAYGYSGYGLSQGCVIATPAALAAQGVVTGSPQPLDLEAYYGHPEHLFPPMTSPQPPRQPIGAILPPMHATSPVQQAWLADNGTEAEYTAACLGSCFCGLLGLLSTMVCCNSRYGVAGALYGFGLLSVLSGMAYSLSALGALSRDTYAEAYSEIYRLCFGMILFVIGIVCITQGRRRLALARIMAGVMSVA